MEILDLVGRSRAIFDADINFYNDELLDMLSGSSVLVIGGAGSIGQAVTIELFKRNPEENCILLILVKIIWSNW